jgi:hypothetical protein
MSRLDRTYDRYRGVGKRRDDQVVWKSTSFPPSVSPPVNEGVSCYKLLSRRREISHACPYGKIRVNYKVLQAGFRGVSWNPAVCRGFSRSHARDRVYPPLVTG